ncbi:tetratricopeptide repeat protein [Mariniblastus sp.]|nr:tetratricopeptide repeat protein [Mariniblastus sp.]
MIFKRWYRDLGGLAAFLLIFYATVVWTSGLGEDEPSSDVNASQMTKARKYSDAAWRRRDYSDAMVHLQDQLDLDPHNSHARFRLARCYHQQLISVHAQMYGFRGNKISDPKQIKSLELKLKELGDQAAQLYQRCTRSHRYRGESLRSLSVLSGLRKDRAGALSALERFLDLNYSTNNGIAQLPELAFLLDDPEFQKLIVIEQKIISEKKSRGPIINSRFKRIALPKS